MGRRSRKRIGEDGPRAVPATASAPAPARPAPAAMRRKAKSVDRPPAPWGSAPLGEISTLLGFVGVIVAWAASSVTIAVVGFALIAVPAIELVVREHFTGFRSHSALLAGLCGFLVGAPTALLKAPYWIAVGLFLVVLAGTFVGFRRLFVRRTGGMGFRA